MTQFPRSYTTTELAQQLGTSARGGGEVQITGIDSVLDAGPQDITFVADNEHARLLARSQAGAAVVSERVVGILNGDRRPLIVVDDAEIAAIHLLRLFDVESAQPELGVHPTAVVHSSAKLGARVRIGAHVSIDAGVSIGAGTVLHAGVRIGANCIIGNDSILYANAVIRHGCAIGNRVIIYQSASIGADGFGYRMDPSRGELLKIPHIGNVIIEDDVEIGANTCIDRGKFGATVIGKGTKIDNLVQIGHNCRVGKNCVIAGLVGISGSVVIGDNVQIGGQAGITEHVNVGANARIGAKSGVMGDIPANGEYLGTPAQPNREVLRQLVAQRKLPDLIRRFSRQIPAED